MLNEIIKNINKWAINECCIESVIIVGSYARGNYTDISDIDLCIIVNNKLKMLKDLSFLNIFGTLIKKDIEYYGACTSIRAWYQEGKEIEFGFVDLSWISLPLDLGTQQVLRNGYRVIYDKSHHFKKISI